MTRKAERKRPLIIVIDREALTDIIERLARERSADIMIAKHASVLEVVDDDGPHHAAGVVCSVGSAGPFLQDLLRWTDREHTSRIPAAVVGKDTDEEAISAVLGRDHVRWIDAGAAERDLGDWLALAVETHDLRMFRSQHDSLSTQLHDARTRLFYGEMASYNPPEGPPCGPPLPTSVEEIQPLRDARAQFERGLIRAAIRECGSLKDASAALGISYTSLWRRLR